jgi:hypothetical protein
VLILLEAKNWKQIEAALRDKNYTNTWEPIEAKVAKGKAKDFVYMGGPLIASDSAWRAIEEQVQNDVQNLPLGVGDTFFHILNVIRVVDCLDVERSKFFRTPYDKGLGEILHYEFQEEKIGTAFLFTIPQKPADIYATDAFKELVEGLSLQDIDFQPPASPLVGLAKLMSPS